MENLLECFNCGKKQKSINKLISHVKIEGILPYRCKGIKCLGAKFGNAESFRTHMKNHFKSSGILPVQFPFGPESYFEDNNDFNETLAVQTQTHPSDLHKKLSNLRIEFLKVFLPIYANEKIARKHAIENTRALCEHFNNSLNLIQDSLLTMELRSEDKILIEEIICHLRDSVSIRSEYMLLKELERSDFYVRSMFVEIARCQQEYRDFDNAVRIQNIVYGVSIFPLNQAFHKLFNHTNLLKTTIEYMNDVRGSETMVNYIQGEHWKRILESKEKSDDTLYLPLMVYFDDFEPNNPLGSHKVIHKLGGIYVKLLCLPPHLACKLWSIIVAMIFYTEDRKEFNNKKILKPLIKMLENLETQGITLETSIGPITKVKIVTCLVVGDNLGLMEILDCNSSFSAFYTCRICIIFKSDRKILTTEDGSLFRKISDYGSHVDNQQFGIKGECAFNQLESFHIYNNFYADIMHDVTEGHCSYVFSKVFHIFRHDKERFPDFKVTKLNRNILSHNFGPGIHAKPLLLPDDYMSKQEYKFRKLPMSASETLTFSRHILFLLKGLVPECPELKLIRQLRNLITSLFTHNVQRSELDLLSMDIEEFLELYREICGDLQPKFHTMVHYPRIIKEVGPLLNIACFSFESAHQPLKKAASASNNQVNLPVTLHKKVEAKFSYGLITSDDHLNKIKFNATKKTVSEDISKLYGLIEPVDIAELYYKGLKMHKLNVIQVTQRHEDPSFVLIKLIVKDEEDFKLIVEELTKFNFDTDLCAYEVNYTNNFYTLPLSTLQLNCYFASCVSKVHSNNYISWI